MEMTEEMIKKADESFEKLEEYFDEFSKENGKKGFVWLTNNETGELIVYTSGEYRKKILDFLETL